MKKLIITLVLPLLLNPLTLRAVVLVDSTFTNSTLGASGRNATNSSNLTPWFLVSSATTGNAAVVNDATIGKSMQVNSGNTVYTAFSSSSLLNGETMTLSLTYRFIATPGASSETFRIGLYNSNSAAAITADLSSIGASDLQQYVGYYSGIAIGVNPSSNGTAMRQRDSGLSSALTSTSQSSSPGFNNSGIVSGTTSHTLEFSIARSGGNLTLTSKIDGNTLLSALDSTSPYFSFNSLALAGVGGTVVLDDILLQTVPEPGTFAMFALGAAFVLYRIRRRVA